MSGPRRGDTTQKEVVPAGREGGPASGQRPWPRGPRPGWQRTRRIAGHSPFPRLSALCHVGARSPRQSGRFGARTAGLSQKVAETGDVEGEEVGPQKEPAHRAQGAHGVHETDVHRRGVTMKKNDELSHYNTLND